MKYFLMLLFAFAFLAGCEKSGIQDSSAEKDVAIESRGRGANVTICHNGNAISVNVNALPAHLAHGDYQLIDADGDGYYTVAGACGAIADCNDANPNVNVTCPPTCVPAGLLAGSVAAQDGADLTNASESDMLAGAAWTVSLNLDCSVTFTITPTLFTGSPYLKALTVGITNAAGDFNLDLTWGSSDATPPVDELVLGTGGVYSATVASGVLPAGELGIFYMVNGRAPDNGNDLQRWIGITSMTKSNDFSGANGWSWLYANRLKITL